MPEPIDVLFLCTGNAARSVMAGAALQRERPELTVETAGTLAVDGQPISFRTRAALADVGLESPGHRSRQADDAMLRRAGLIIGLAPEHVRWVRREHPEMASRTATLIRLVTVLGPGQASGDELRQARESRLAGLGLAEVDLELWEEVVDPGGADVDAFVLCARGIVALIDRLAPHL